MAGRHRKRVDTGIYRDRYGLAAIVHARPHAPVEKRFPFGTPLHEVHRWRTEERLRLLNLTTDRVTPPTRGTLTADAARYLRLVAHLTSWKSRKSEIHAWLDGFGDRHRGRISRTDVLETRQQWLAEDYAPKTVNHRVRALRHLYRTLDGTHAATPCDDVPKLAEPSPQPVAVPERTIKAVARKLTDPKTRARHMVLSATGQRPAQVMRATLADVDLRRCVWSIREAKGGHPVPLFLNRDMVGAWRAFIAAAAWGPYDTSTHAKRLYAAGWPQGIRPYNTKHSVGIRLAERGAEWKDTRAYFGHKDVKTTRIYTGRVFSRLKQVSRLLDGRLGWHTKKRPARVRKSRSSGGS